MSCPDSVRSRTTALSVEDNKAMAYATLAKGQGYEPVQKIGIHAQTLKAVVRERTESGQDMPADLFNTFVGNQTKITRRQ